MANSGAHTLYIVSLLVFGALAQPALFILWRHGRHGILGWFYLQLLCAIRTIGAVVELKAIANNTTQSTGVVIVNSVGLSPLILATLGIMHEARRARNANIRKKLEWFLVINMHLLVSLGLILVILGIVHVEKKHEEANTSLAIKLGLLVVVACYLTMFVWALFSLKGHRHNDPMLYANGSALLKGVLASMPFIGIRLIYGVLTMILKNPKFANSIGWKIFLDVIPEVTVATIFIIVGFLTRNMWRERLPEVKAEGYPLQEPPFGPSGAQRYTGQDQAF